MLTKHNSWVSTIIIKPAQLAIICLSFAEYVVEAFAFECPPPENIIKIVGVTTVGEKIHVPENVATWNEKNFSEDAPSYSLTYLIYMYHNSLEPILRLEWVQLHL